MGFYKVLFDSMSTNAPNYKGLYRSEPFPQSDENKRFMSLWQRYVQNSDKSIGVTNELTVDELRELAVLSTQDTKDCYELIYFSKTSECPHPAVYYGIDVIGLGCYSMVGENFFANSEELSKGIYHLYDVINQHFRAKLNANGLFHIIEDATSFRMVLNDLTELSPGSVEQDLWEIVHIYKVI